MPLSRCDQLTIRIYIQLRCFDMLEDAPIAQSVEQLGVQHIVYAHQAQRSKEEDSKQRPDGRSKIIHPLVAPEPGDQCGAKAAGWIQAGARDGRSLPVDERHQECFCMPLSLALQSLSLGYWWP